MRGLLRVFWLLDLRGQHYAKATGAKAGEVLPPLFWVVGQFLTVSLLTTLVLLGRVDLYVFSAAHLALSALLTFSALIVEIDEAVFHPRDHAVIAHRPVPLRTYALARFGNLLRYVGLLSSALLIFPLVVGATLPEARLGFVPSYLLAFLATQLAVTALVVLAHAFVQRGGEGLKSALAWVQILAILGLFYGGQAMIRQGSTALTELAASRPSWLAFTPPGWLAAQIELGSFGATSRLVGAVAFAVLLAWVAAVHLARAYGRTREGGVLLATRDLPEGGSARILLVRSRPTRAAHWLTRAMLRRDHELKARLWPHLALPAAVAAMAFVVGRAGDPWRAPEGLELTLALPPVLVATVPLLMLALRYGRDPRASELLAAARSRAPGAFDAGVRRALWTVVLGPIVVGITIAYAVAWAAPLHALAHGAFLVACLVPAVSVAQRVLLREVPFSRPPRRGLVDGQTMAVSAVFATVGGALAVGYWQLAIRPEWLGPGLGGFALVALVVGWLGGRR